MAVQVPAALIAWILLRYGVRVGARLIFLAGRALAERGMQRTRLFLTRPQIRKVKKREFPGIEDRLRGKPPRGPLPAWYTSISHDC